MEPLIKHKSIFNSLYVKLSTTINFICTCKKHFYTNTLFQKSQPHLLWVFNSCILKTSTARSLQRSPSCSFFRIQLCAWAVGRLYSKRKYFSASFKSSRSLKFLLSCYSKFPDPILLLVKTDFNYIFHTEQWDSHIKKKTKQNQLHYIEKDRMKRLRNRQSNSSYIWLHTCGNIDMYSLDRHP